MRKAEETVAGGPPSPLLARNISPVMGRMAWPVLDTREYTAKKLGKIKADLKIVTQFAIIIASYVHGG